MQACTSRQLVSMHTVVAWLAHRLGTQAHKFGRVQVYCRDRREQTNNAAPAYAACTTTCTYTGTHDMSPTTTTCTLRAQSSAGYNKLYRGSGLKAAVSDVIVLL